MDLADYLRGLASKRLLGDKWRLSGGEWLKVERR